MNALGRFAAVSCLALTAGCATGVPRLAADSQVVPASVSGESSYGLFLAGQEAIAGGKGEAASAYFAKAAGQSGGGEVALLNAHTFTAALLAGDVKTAAAIPATDTDEPAVRHLSGLTQAVEALAEGQGAKARAILAGPAVAATRSAAASLLTPFAAAAAGDAEAAIAHPVIDNDPVAQFFASLDQGKLFERERRYDEAETAFRALIAHGDPGGLASASLGALLERRGRAADAVAIYDVALARAPGDRFLQAARRRAAAHQPAPPLPSLRQDAAEALIAPASVMVVQKEEELALAYLRLALRLDPSRDNAWMLVGDILADFGDADAARAAYMTPKAGDENYVAARGKLAWSYQTAGRKDDALKAARETIAAAPSSDDAATTLADLLRADDRYDESIAILDKVIAGQGARPDWRLLYMRAVDYQESARWPLAERDLSAALAERPDEPELLNFLGYSWIDRGEKLKQAIAMVQKAVDADPKSGAMLDSLGWGYYRLGDYAKAVEKLEAAVVIEAGDPDVNNHLGDAYWRVGRRIEARYQWDRVLGLEPTPKLRGEVEAKLKYGLSAMSPAAGS